MGKQGGSSGKNGRGGGVGRGRGDAPISFGDESKRSKLFKVKKLPSHLNWKDLEFLSSSRGDPKESKEKPSPSIRGKERGFENTKGNQVWKRKISVKKKKIIQKYFKED